MPLITQEIKVTDRIAQGKRDAEAGKAPRTPMAEDMCAAYWQGYRSVKAKR